MSPSAVVVPLFLLCSSAQAADPAGLDAVRAEEARRSKALVAEGFNLTHGFRLAQGDPRVPIHLDFIVPEAGELTLSIWSETTHGEVSVHIVGPDHQPQLEWVGRQGETRVVRDLAVGSYALEIDRSKAGAGEALFGVKGSVVSPCALDSERVHELPAAPGKGFHWPYYLFVPKEVRSSHLLIAPNNTGFSTESLDLLRASASCQLNDEVELATRLGAPLLVPLFPRPSVATPEENLYLHALSRAALTTKVAAWARVDLQLVAMIRDAGAVLKSGGAQVDGRVLLTGFSASGSFVNRFAMLHPEEVMAVACGSPGGWPLAPLEKLDGEALPYPVGLAEVGTLTGLAPSQEALRAVRWFFFLGDRDENDAVPFRDSFSKSDQELVFRRFGPKPVARWKEAERLYRLAGLDAHFALYPGAAHEVTDAMRADLTRFFEDSIKQADARPGAK